MMEKHAAISKGILSGLRVLELGHFVAAPFCTRLLGDLGADIIKVEPLGGDPVRDWGAQLDGQSLWWSVHGRNKKSIALDLKHEDGRRVVLDLVEHCDAVVENFRPGGLERIGLGPKVLRERNKDLIIAHISGYGQTGPDRDQAAFGVIGEAIGGIRYLTNHPPDTTDMPSVRVGVSLGDSLAGLYAAFGVVAALWHKERYGANRRYQTLDVALTESVLSLMEGMLPEYGKLNKIKQPTGGAIATAAPSNAYPTKDQDWVLIAANSEPLFARLAVLMEREDLLSDPRFHNNSSRVRHTTELDEAICAWSIKSDTANLLERLKTANIPSSKVYTAADIAEDPQYRSRGMVREVDDPLLGKVLHPGIVPRFGDDPGVIARTGPSIGGDSQAITHDLLGYSEEQIAQLYKKGVMR